MSHVIQVDHKGGDLFQIAVGDHLLHADQPVDAGGSDAAPTPTELLIASLAACVAFYTRRYLVRHQLPEDGLSVDAGFVMADRPARVGEVSLTIHLPVGVPEERRDALLAVASRCTVHNTLQQPPRVTLGLGSA